MHARGMRACVKLPNEPIPQLENAEREVAAATGQSRFAKEALAAAEAKAIQKMMNVAKPPVKAEGPGGGPAEALVVGQSGMIVAVSSVIVDPTAASPHPRQAA